MTPPAKRVKSNNDQHFRDSRESATVEIHEELRTMPCPISLSKVRLISLSRAETRVRMTPEVVVHHQRNYGHNGEDGSCLMAKSQCDTLLLN